MATSEANPAPIVYVVDDEADVRMVVSRILAAAGFEVHAFASADHAQTALTRASLLRVPADVVLLDMALDAHWDSLQQAEDLLHAITQRQPRPEIILMSGHLSSDEFFGYIMKGATDYVAKPWTTSDLLERVRECAVRGRKKFLHHHAIGATARTAPRDAFLSYSSRDTELALGVRRVLERMGISTWYAPADVPFGESWPERLETALGDCPVFIVLVTPSALQSAYVMQEVSRAAARREMERQGFLLVPVVHGIAATSLPESLRRLQAVDLTSQYGLADTVIKLADRISQFIEQLGRERQRERRRSDRRAYRERRGSAVS